MLIVGANRGINPPRTSENILRCEKCLIVTTQHPMGISNRLTVVLQQELH